MTKRIHTLDRPVELEALGLILPHEHLFTNLRGPHVRDYAHGDAAAVVNLVGQYLAEIGPASLYLGPCPNRAGRLGGGRSCAARSLRGARRSGRAVPITDRNT